MISILDSWAHLEICHITLLYMIIVEWDGLPEWLDQSQVFNNLLRYTTC